jgi:hypothetical protein
MVGSESRGVRGMLVAVSRTGCWLTALKSEVCEADSDDSGGMDRCLKGGFSDAVCHASVRRVRALYGSVTYHGRSLLSHFVVRTLPPQ